MKELLCDFDNVDDSDDHCRWLSDELDKAGGEIVVRYKKSSTQRKAVLAKLTPEERKILGF